MFIADGNIRILFLIWPNSGLFYLFSSFSYSKNTNWKKAYMVCLGIEPLAADGRCRRNHGANAGAKRI